MEVELSDNVALNSNLIKVYPNPTKNTLFIDCGLDYIELNDYTIKILSSTGELVYVSKVNQETHSINMDEFGDSGLYFIQFIDDLLNIKASRKIILQ
ncbi:MAG: T9SS type A sorting domain-containing protein [Bacteroidetes bacterium]|nr:T9SS type A sorting domain-containing protein [Bacteroidota bacterium]